MVYGCTVELVGVYGNKKHNIQKTGGHICQDLICGTNDRVKNCLLWKAKISPIGNLRQLWRRLLIRYCKIYERPKYRQLETYAKFGVGLKSAISGLPSGVPASLTTQIVSMHLNYPKTILRSSWLAMLSRRYMVVKIRAVTSSWNFNRDSAWWNREYSLCRNKRYLDSREIALIARIST